MNRDEMSLFLASFLEREITVFDMPTKDDWRILEEYFSTKFSLEFKAFIELMSEFSFPGDIFNVTQPGTTNGNDLIIFTYETERKVSHWPKDFVPFYGIGNGDYFAVSAREDEKSPVYYRYHEDGRIEKYCDSFEEWVKRLPIFLEGE